MGESPAPAASRPPLFCGDIDIRIAGDGTWFHEGCPIGRLPLVKLFASVLTRDDDGDYWLVTPVEKARIAVDDVPFVAVELEAQGSGEAQRLRFRTNLDEWVSADTAPPSRLPHAAGVAGEGALSQCARRAGGAGGARALLCAGGALRRAGDRRQAGARRLERRKILPLRRRARTLCRQRLMRTDILRGVARRAPGAPDQPWEAVIAAAERAPDARVPGSRRHVRESSRILPPAEPIAPAAVLVAVIERAGALSVLLTRRAERLARHAGQISFPGGRADPGDGTPQKTALREAEEEIGLPPKCKWRSPAGSTTIWSAPAIASRPWWGWSRRRRPSPRTRSEVAEIFEVPLPFVLEPANYRRDRLTVGGIDRRFYVLPYGAYHVWGATAAILVNFRDVVRASC